MQPRALCLKECEVDTPPRGIETPDEFDHLPLGAAGFGASQEKRDRQRAAGLHVVNLSKRGAIAVSG